MVRKTLSSVNAFYTQPIFVFWTHYVIVNRNNEVFEMKMEI